MDDKIMWQWQVVSDRGPWKKRKGSRLTWEMTEKHAADWQSKNPEMVIEKVPGSGYQRKDMSGHPLKGFNWRSQQGKDG